MKDVIVVYAIEHNWRMMFSSDAGLQQCRHNGGRCKVGNTYSRVIFLTNVLR